MVKIQIIFRYNFMSYFYIKQVFWVKKTKIRNKIMKIR